MDPTPEHGASLLQRLFSFARVHHKVLLGAVSGGALTVLGSIAWFGDPFGKAQTFGMIWVDSPEIYTRERLVNDRLIQDAWLNRQLNNKDIRDSLQMHQEKRDAALRVHAVDAEGASAQAAAGAGAAAAAATEPDLKPSSQMQLFAENDYRDLVRSLIIENQLDDRHDLNGNSLYLLKFDASVAPGANTQASALVKIKLTGPMPSAQHGSERKPLKNSLDELGNDDNIREWRAIYGKWIENLRWRLNQAHKELKQTYRNNEFGHNDYARLIGFVARTANVLPESAATCRGGIATMLGQSADSPALRPEDHDARKRCVQAHVTLIVKARDAQAAAKPYLSMPRELLESTATQGPAIPRAEAFAMTVDKELNKLLSASFASKTMQLVIGIPVAESKFFNNSFGEAPELHHLVQLGFIGTSDPNGDDDGGFVVTPKEFAIDAIPADRLNDAGYRKVTASETATAGAQGAKFDAVLDGSEMELRISGDDKARIGTYAFRKADFRMSEGVYHAVAEVGLVNFARKARESTRAFTYSVTPKERGDTVVSSLGSSTSLQGAWAPRGDDKSASDIQMRRESAARAINRRGAVVGFGGTPVDHGPVEFGWIIGPRQIAADGQRIVYIQGPAQHSLSALVSIPSWWTRVDLQVTTSWLGADGKPVGGEQVGNTFGIDVPADFEPLETSLLQVPQLGPELMDSRLDQVHIKACRSGAIVIPGRRLWRSTRVTLGYQAADEISVLPNMKGIIAKFDRVQDQKTLSDDAGAKDAKGPREIRRAIRVWTSQGTVTLPTAAWIEIPEGGCKDADPKSPST